MPVIRDTNVIPVDTILSIQALEPRIREVVPMLGVEGRNGMQPHLLGCPVMIDSIHVRKNGLAMPRALYGMSDPGGVLNHA
jgi:hypothetical protein